MRIEELVLKNFGKFSNRTITLRDGVNVIYGENESGKTTLHTFIGSMFYGMERGRGRAAATDVFSRYEPWENPNYYSGAVRFVCGGRTFYLQRHFDKYAKGASLICEDDGEELSLEDGDLEALLDGMQKSIYDNTISVGQSEAQTKEALAIELKNYATNYYASGNEELQLDGAFRYLKEREKELQKEERVREQKKQDKREKLELEVSYVWRDVHKLEEELEEVSEKLSLCEEEDEKAMQRAEFYRKKAEANAQRTKKWRVHPMMYIGMILTIVLLIVLLEQPWNYLWGIVMFLIYGIYVWNRLKDGKKKPSDEEEETEEEEETTVSGEKLRWEMERIQGEYKDKKIYYNNLKEQMAEIDSADEEEPERRLRQEALREAAARLTFLSNEMRQEVGMRLNRRVSEILDAVTGGKYEKLLVDEELHMTLLKDGQRITPGQVSKGTVEQIYFALRMAASEILHEEDLPIILDDAFVYYDEERLSHTLQWLAGQGRQVLLFTCRKREAELLEESGIEYNFVELQSDEMTWRK